jgi:hypothetical protein
LSSPARNAQADLTRQKIADAARAVPLERGYEATTIGAIAERAGVAARIANQIHDAERGELELLRGTVAV